MGSFFESHPAIGKLFYANRYLFQLDDIFYAGMAYVLILCWFIWSAAWLNLYALGSQPEKLEDRKYQIEQVWSLSW